MVFHFTIDTFLNKYILPSQVSRLPPPLRRLAGGHKPSEKPDYLIWLEILIASFCGIALIEGVFKSHTVFSSHNSPIIIASYGATAILCFNAIQAPLSQPRNILMGHFVSALTGVCIQKLFSLGKGGTDNYWASGALSVGVASALMSVLNCVHPPAGASALLPSIDEDIQKMSWWYLPAHLVSSVLIICVACITGNVFRKYPAYWWTPAEIKRPEKKNDQPEEQTEKQTDKTNKAKVQNGTSTSLSDPKDSVVDSYNQINRTESTSITITAEGITIPQSLDVNELDLEWLESFHNRLKT